MAWRAIQDTVPTSVSLDELTPAAERLYWRMLSQTDSWGRLQGEAPKVRRKCLPGLKVTDKSVEGWLLELQQVGRIQRYRVADQVFCQLTDFDANQPKDALSKRGAPRFPAFPGDSPLLPPTPEFSPVEGEGDREVESPNGLLAQVHLNGSAKPADAVQVVYEHWRQARGKTDPRYRQISDARRQKIKSRLREFTPEQLVRAIDGVALDPWEERSRHDDLTTIFRSREKVDGWLSLAETTTLKTDPAERLRRRMAERGEA